MSGRSVSPDDVEGVNPEALRAAATDAQGGGQSAGIPAAGTIDAPADATPAGAPGLHHWKGGYITEPGLNDRGDVFFAAVEMTRMPMILTDPNQPDNPVVFANRAFHDLTGYEESDIVGRNCRFLQGPGTDRATVKELREALAAVRPISTEILNYRRDGTPFWNACFIAPVFAKDGRLLYFFASQLDVTRRRTSEQAFRQAQKLEAIGQLTAGLAHDFNNLLQIVAGNLETVLREPVSERQRQRLENARKAADRGAKLTRQLLAFARKTRLEPKPVDLSTQIFEFSDMLESTLGRDVELAFDLRRSLPASNIDPVHLEMAVLNAAINARDAMESGGLLTIRTRRLHLNGDAESRQLKPGDYVALEIEDTGVGMPPDVLEHAIEPFFTTKEPGKGTGLGLAMVHGFVQQSLGRLEIESVPGKGTTVRMIFPSSTLAVGPRPETAVEPAFGTGAERVGDETILLVEDNEDVALTARDHLESLGYRVLVAADGEAALRLAEEHRDRIALLFSDIIMPGGMNGLQLADEVERRLPQLPVLMTTGFNAQSPGIDRADRVGRDVLAKPYRRQELADRVRAAIDSRRPGGRSIRPLMEHSVAEE